MLNPERPRGGGEAAGHRQGDSQVEKGRELVTRKLCVCVPPSMTTWSLNSMNHPELPER